MSLAVRAIASIAAASAVPEWVRKNKVREIASVQWFDGSGNRNCAFKATRTQSFMCSSPR